VDYGLSWVIPSRRAVVITGFWRSGTTWLQQLVASALGAKRIFEPFYPKIDRYASLTGVEDRQLGSLHHAWMPFFGHTCTRNRDVQEYLSDCLTGRISLKHESGEQGYWLRSSRAYQTEAFRLRTVVKFVRGQLMLPGLLSAFDVPILHYRRDPRAVLASFKRKGWVDWFRCDAPLQKLLLWGEDERDEYFGQWNEQIEQIDQTGSAFAQVAAYWVLTERYVDEVASENDAVEIVHFQRVKEERNAYLLGVLGELGVQGAQPVPEEVFEKRSMTAQETAQAPTEQRTRDWRDTLSESEIDDIDHALEGFDFLQPVFPE